MVLPSAPVMSDGAAAEVAVEAINVADIVVSFSSAGPAPAMTQTVALRPAPRHEGDAVFRLLPRLSPTSLAP
jgi:hypothetical protein